MILLTIHVGYIYGFSVMEMTGLPSGTVYPAMRRLERDELIRSQWGCSPVLEVLEQLWYGSTEAHRARAGA